MVISLATFSDGNLAVTLHESWSDAYQALRENYDPEGDYNNVPDEQIQRVLLQDMDVFSTVTDHENE